MTHKFFSRISILIVILIAAIAIPVNVLAGGVCGGTYIVESGETFSSIAARCGTSASAIMSANPGVSEPLKTGQAITVPGITYNAPIIDGASSSQNQVNYGPINYSGSYTVQVGDTFSSIATRYGVSMNALWAANPNIWDINYIFVGQVIHVPTSSDSGSSSAGVISTLPAEPEHLSYGSVPPGAPKGRVDLSNKANGNVYVSLQGTTADGIHVINEYSVNGQMQVKVPAGSYTYVASVGGVKFVGQFHLSSDSEIKMTFYAKKVVVE